jgi:hypothetical protein
VCPPGASPAVFRMPRWQPSFLDAPWRLELMISNACAARNRWLSRLDSRQRARPTE